MGNWDILLVMILLWVLHIPSTHQQKNYQSQVLLQLRKHFEYPTQLESWANYNGNLCNTSLSKAFTVTCNGDIVTELRIMGDKPSKGTEFDGFAIPNVTLSKGFSIDTLVTTLARLTGLRIVSLVSLGIWGHLPDKIHRLSSLEVLDLSSNFLYGGIPPQISSMVSLKTLTLDGNFFNETLPKWLDSLSNLTSLSLKKNRFNGRFPSSICKISTLTYMALSHNKLSGKLPDLSSFSDLHMLDLRENHFNSQLPLMPKGLLTALLSNNSFSGKIPKQFGELNQLQHLDLSYNFLSGTPPAGLFSLPSISYLNLASNMLSGSLPSHLSCGKELGFVDISSNRLTGGLPSCLGTNSDKRAVKVGGNCLSAYVRNQHHESYCKAQHMMEVQSTRKKRMLVVGLTVGIVTVVAFLLLVMFVLFRRYHSKYDAEQHPFPKFVQDNSQPVLSAELLANARLISQAAKTGTQGAPVYQIYSLEELEDATDNFDIMNLLGEGSMGKVYKGRLTNGNHVAIRSMSLFKRHSMQSLKIRMDFLSKLRHSHLVGLLGHCIDGGALDQSGASRIFLVYEYMPNGNFRAHLSETSPMKALKWSERLAILIDIAKAIHFLHTGIIPSSFYNRLRTHNILIDDNRIAKLSDYGMSVFTEDIQKLEGKGDGSKSWQMEKSEDDVYDFGFILLEALVGPIVTGKGEAFLLNEMASFGSQNGQKKIVDPIVLTTSFQESLSIVISITNKCISPGSSTRPSFEDVLWNLQYAAQVQASSESEHKSDNTL